MTGALQNNDLSEGGYLLWHIRFQMHVYHAALVSHNAQLEQSVWETASLKSMQISALIVVLVQVHALQVQLSRHNTVPKNYKQRFAKSNRTPISFADNFLFGVCIQKKSRF